MKRPAGLLRDAVVAHKPDPSGSRGAKGYDYQRAWAFCCLLKLHDDKQSFLMLFDYHDDVVVLNSPQDPDSVTFYQIKSRDDRPWTVHELIAPNVKKGTGQAGHHSAKLMPAPSPSTDASSRGQSVLGKLYANAAKFSGFDVSLRLVSNQRLNVQLENGGNAIERIDVDFNQLHQKHRIDICKAIRKELGLDQVPVLDAILQFQWTDLSSGDEETHAVGKLTEYLRRAFPGRNPSANEIYERIMREIRRKNNHRWALVEFDEVRRHKGITDREFADMIIASACHRSPVERWANVQSMLMAERVPVGKIMALERAWDRYASLRTDPRDPTTDWLRVHAAEFTEPYIENPLSLEQLTTFMACGLTDLRTRLSMEYRHGSALSDKLPIRQDVEIEAALLYELSHGQEARQLQAAYPQSQEEAT